jgi:hypothetical protein
MNGGDEDGPQLELGDLSGLGIARRLGAPDLRADILQEDAEGNRVGDLRYRFRAINADCNLPGGEQPGNEEKDAFDGGHFHIFAWLSFSSTSALPTSAAGLSNKGHV